MELIVAVDLNNAIGKDGDLLVHLKPDLKRLREMTTGNIIVMGSKTYMSFPKRPLPNRENLVLTRHPELYPEVKCFTDINQLLEYEKTADKTIFVLGGGDVYNQLLPYCTKAHITRIISEFEADTYFPDLGEEWKKVWEGEIITTEEYPFRYEEYHR